MLSPHAPPPKPLGSRWWRVGGAPRSLFHSRLSSSKITATRCTDRDDDSDLFFPSCLPRYGTLLGSFLLLSIGLSAKPDNGITSWAKDEAMKRRYGSE